MAAPLPLALRQRIVDAYLNGEGSFREIAARFNVGTATAKRLVWRHRRQGTVEPDAMGGKRHEYKVDEEGEKYIRFLLEDEPTWTRQELCDEYKDAFGVDVSVATMGRVIRRLGLTRKRG